MVLAIWLRGAMHNALLEINVDSLDVQCLGFHSCTLRLFSFFS